MIKYDILYCDFISVVRLCFWEQDYFPLIIVLCSKMLPTTLVTCCIMGWPEQPCCGVFCNCDEGVTQMLNWTLMCKYCFRWTLCRMIRHSALLRPLDREWCPSRKAPTCIWVTSSCSLIPYHSTPLSCSKLQLSTHTWGQREGVHIKAEMSKEQDSQALMSDCPAASTPVHKGVCVGIAVLLTCSHYIYMHTCLMG